MDYNWNSWLIKTKKKCVDASLPVHTWSTIIESLMTYDVSLKQYVPSVTKDLILDTPAYSE